jgi:Trypsin-like peptidase domain
MNDGEYWVEIHQQGKRFGAGFLLARRFVLTAHHCLHDCAVGNDKVQLSFATGRTIQGLIVERAAEADLALITITEAESSGVTAPFPDRSMPGEMWRAPYRPSDTDPYLSGGVQHGSMRYQCEGGGSIEALQLACAEHIGDYSGYSGSPIERSIGNSSTAILGVLIEQYPDRMIPGRGSDVLFAATIAEALRRFEYFDVWHLYRVLCPQQDAPSPRSSEPVRSTAESLTGWASPQRMTPDEAADPGKAIGDRMYANLREWGERGLLDQTQIAMLNYEIAKAAINKAFSGDASA